MLVGQLLVLKLVMDALGYEPDISNVKERKKRQKAIYLAQLFGVDLGYRYGWYLMGPYSPPLARDYYRLQERLDLGETVEGPTLKESVVEKLNKAVQLIRSREKPQALDEAGWIELLASWHYLLRVSKETSEKAMDVMRRQKPDLAKHIDRASSALESSGI